VFNFAAIPESSNLNSTTIQSADRVLGKPPPKLAVAVNIGAKSIQKVSPGPDNTYQAGYKRRPNLNGTNPLYGKSSRLATSDVGGGRSTASLFTRLPGPVGTWLAAGRHLV
jgi:hypothetical protein